MLIWKVKNELGQEYLIFGENFNEIQKKFKKIDWQIYKIDPIDNENEIYPTESQYEIS